MESEIGRPITDEENHEDMLSQHVAWQEENETASSQIDESQVKESAVDGQYQDWQAQDEAADYAAFEALMEDTRKLSSFIKACI